MFSLQLRNKNNKNDDMFIGHNWIYGDSFEMHVAKALCVFSNGLANTFFQHINDVLTLIAIMHKAIVEDVRAAS